MKVLKTIVLGASVLCSTYSNACVNGKGYFPKNNWKISPEFNSAGISEKSFNETIEKIKNYYSPYFRSAGGNLVVQQDWSDGTVNAFANREGNNWIIKMFGGLARHPSMTKDGFALVMCHEIGHHLGGAPRYESGASWASNEGQSDYFAGSKCLRKIFEDENNLDEVAKLNVPSEVRTKCEEQHGNSEEGAVCMRVSMAGHATSSMFAQLSNGTSPDFTKPDTKVVTKTYDSHPHYQCRLDTYFQSALCEVHKDVQIGQNNPNAGVCSRPGGHEIGMRPLCWYLPTNFNPDPDPDPNDPPSGGIANTPTVNGQIQVTSRNPNGIIPITVDVSKFQGAHGLAFEASKPNVTFSNPNGTAPDPSNALGHVMYQGTKGVYRLHPARELPSWGRYQFRVIPLDRQGKPVGRFSNPFTLILSP
tara:strand:- start:207752 stop:209005 length:1254 start_codon:yes stop_codon:yes gene_type:complete